MTWPVRSRLLAFYVASPAASTWVVVGSVPTGKTWLVKQWTAYNGGGAARDFLLGIRIGATDCIVQQAKALGSGLIVGTTGLSMVLPSSSHLLIWSSTAQPIQVHVSGAELG